MRTRTSMDLSLIARWGNPYSKGSGSHTSERGPTKVGQIGRAHVLNSSHLGISYAVFCLKKKKLKRIRPRQLDAADLQRAVTGFRRRCHGPTQSRGDTERVGTSARFQLLDVRFLHAIPRI